MTTNDIESITWYGKSWYGYGHYKVMDVLTNVSIQSDQVIAVSRVTSSTVVLSLSHVLSAPITVQFKKDYFTNEHASLLRDYVCLNDIRSKNALNAFNRALNVLKYSSIVLTKDPYWIRVIGSEDKQMTIESLDEDGNYLLCMKI